MAQTYPINMPIPPVDLNLTLIVDEHLSHNEEDRVFKIAVMIS